MIRVQRLIREAGDARDAILVTYEGDGIIAAADIDCRHPELAIQLLEHALVAAKQAKRDDDSDGQIDWSTEP